MTIYCPRCQLPLSVEGLDGRNRYVTCPACLELITLHATPPALPVPALPLNYQGPSGDVEAELQRDLKFVVWGIVAFGGMAIVGFVVAQGITGGIGPARAWLGWIAIVTAVVAAVSLAMHFRRRTRLRSGVPVRLRSGGQQAARIVVLGVTGLLLIVITAVAAVALLLVACLALAAGSGGPF